MPSLVTHHHFAITALKNSPAYIKACVTENPQIFRWGAQGPDIMYFHNAPMKSKIADIGGIFHSDKTYKSIKTLTSIAREINDPTLLIYLLGYICHYVLDSSAHPYVNYVTKHKMGDYFGLSEPALHRLCESEIDAMVITNFITGDQHTYEAFKLLHYNKEDAYTIGELYSKTAWEVYGIKISASQIAKSMKSMKNVYSFLHDETGKRIQQLRAVEKTINQRGMLYTLVRPIKSLECDAANLKHDTWYDANKPNIPKTDSIFEILDENINTATRLMSLIYDVYHKNHELSEVFFGYDFLGNPVNC